MVLKESVRFLSYYILKKPYKQLLNNGGRLIPVRGKSDKAFFYGYYDKSPEFLGRILFHEMCNGYVNIVVKDVDSEKEQIIAESKAYNWQMGTRAMWIDEDTIAYNDFDGIKYVCRIYSLSEKKIIRTLGKAFQDYSPHGFFLGVNYQRLRSYAKEYGYYCLPELSEKEFDNYNNDGIWIIDATTGDVQLLLSILDVMNCETEEKFSRGKHFVNHVMISPDGYSFIFIHRYYVRKKRYDRLMYYDFKKKFLTCLLNDKMQSHYCWLDNQHVFGYGGYQGRNEFHTINVLTGEVEPCETLTNIHPKDGHPTVHGDWAVIDSYPNLSRMQELIAFNFKTKQIVKFLELYHDLRHIGFNRCDLHPRFSDDGKRVYFDTIYTGLRQLCYIDVSKILN